VDRLTIACIGAGSEPGARSHAFMDVINKLSDMYDFRAVCDLNEIARERAAAQFGIPAAYADLRSMLEAEELDVVLRLTPTDSSVATCVVAAQHGCHVISEIPFDTTRARADLIRRACQDNGVKLEIAENVWLWPEERLKRRIVESGLIGEPVHARLKYPCGSYHGFNGVRMILGIAPTRVLGYGGEVAVTPLPAYGGGIMTSVQWDGGVVEFESGLKCIFEMPPKKPAWERNWDIVGTDGYLSGENLYLFAEGHHHGAGSEERHPIESVTEEVNGETVLKAVRVNTDPVIEWENPYAKYGISGTDDIAKAAIFESMYRAVTEDKDPVYGAANARLDQELVIAVKESAWQGSQWLDLPLGDTTSVEQAIHEEFQRRYGCDPLGDIEKQLACRYTRLSVMWTIAGWL